ncbi:hypothetical protein OCOJLMKI_0823 [Methylobacterium iners]|uniref:Uncharacterized protein n=1 Tax=Methylobacterium iners TaxID=418707 RepID=A0ABQ4RVK7_9HYPH|nr:hypothetical protein OCOJLMKI_0823 [Methylobacterium iners]
MRQPKQHHSVVVTPCPLNPKLFTWEIHGGDHRISLNAYTYHTRWAAKAAGLTALHWHLTLSPTHLFRVRSRAAAIVISAK